MTNAEFLALLGEKVVEAYLLQKRIADLEAELQRLTEAAKAEDAKKGASNGEAV